MSMDEPASSQDLQDTEMSDAAAEDPELALGKCTKSMHICNNYSLLYEKNRTYRC